MKRTREVIVADLEQTTHALEAAQAECSVLFKKESALQRELVEAEQHSRLTRALVLPWSELQRIASLPGCTRIWGTGGDWLDRLLEQCPYDCILCNRRPGIHRDTDTDDVSPCFSAFPRITSEGELDCWFLLCDDCAWTDDDAHARALAAFAKTGECPALVRVDARWFENGFTDILAESAAECEQQLAAQLAKVRELREHDHDVLPTRIVEEYARVFGCSSKVQEFAHGTLVSNVEGNKGLGADTLAERLCDHLKVPYEVKIGRGSALRECCKRLKEYFEGFIS